MGLLMGMKFICFILGGILGIMIGAYMVSKSRTPNSEIAIKLSNIMNASMLDCVTKNIITKEQVHDIETVFHRKSEVNFKGIKARHTDKKE